MVTSVATNTKIFDTFDTFSAFGTVITAHTVKAQPTFTAKHVVGTVLTFFSAFRTYNGTVGTTLTAVAYLIYTVIT